MDLDISPIIVPESLENLKLPSPELLQYYDNTNNRIIWIDDEIGDQMLSYSKNIIKWNMEDRDIPVEERKPIKIMIFSIGGSLYACNHFIDIIEMSKTPVYGYNVGMALSAAFMILIACHKKYCTRTSTALIHQGSSSISGNATDVLNGVKNYTVQLKEIRDYILKKTKIGAKLYNTKLKEDWYLTAEDQVKYGVVDGIVNNIEDLM